MRCIGLSLKSVANSSNFCNVNDNGNASNGDAARSGGDRPLLARR